MIDTENDIQRDTTRPSHRRYFRFSLKWLLASMAILCIALGMHTSLERKSREMLAVNDAIESAIEKNVDSEPKNTTFAMPPALRLSTANFTKRTRAAANQNRQGAWGLFSGRTLHAMSGYDVELNDSGALAAPQTNANVPIQLLNHYVQGLDQVGLKQLSITNGPDQATAIWQIPDHGATVIIDVNLDASAKKAKVRIIFIQNDRATIW